MGSRRGNVSRSGARSFAAKPDLVSQTLVYPFTLVTNPTYNDGHGGLTLNGDSGAPASQQILQIKNSSGTILWTVPVAGGPKTHAKDMRAYNAPGGSYVGFDASRNPGCLHLPDGTSSQGSRVWSGTGAPSASTIGGAAVAGDYYFRRCALARPTLIAASVTTHLTSPTVTELAVGSGTLSTSETTKLLDGVPQAGDLLVVTVSSTNSSQTLTVGADSGITATGTDGGVSQNDGTRYIRIFSRVVQSGDISSSQIIATPSAYSGPARRISAWVFRHPGGFSTTGSKHGCALYASDSENVTSNTTVTLSATGPSTLASVAVAASYHSAAITFSATGAVWDSGDATNDDPEVTATTRAVIAVKPGLGTNTSSTPGYETGGASVVYSGMNSSTFTAALGIWAVTAQAVDPAEPTIYVCTANGTPGTWAAVI